MTWKKDEYKMNLIFKFIKLIFDVYNDYLIALKLENGFDTFEKVKQILSKFL